jgi:hypothetical protein
MKVRNYSTKLDLVRERKVRCWGCLPQRKVAVVFSFFSLHTLFNIRYRRSLMNILFVYLINVDKFAIFSFVFPLLVGVFLSFFCLFYKRIRTLRYLRWLPSTEPEPQHSTQRPSDGNLHAAERGQATGIEIGRETGNAVNSLEVDAERAPPVRTSGSERSGEGQPDEESLGWNSGPAWRCPDPNTPEVAKGTKKIEGKKKKQPQKLSPIRGWRGGEGGEDRKTGEMCCSESTGSGGECVPPATISDMIER